MADPVAKAALDRAIEDHDQLVLFYQPIHDARSGAIVAAEALLRQRRESGEVRDATIIHETAEKSSGPELFALDSVVVKRAYTEAAEWQNGGHPDVHLNVNLSPREFQEGNVIDRLTALVTSCGVDTAKVNLEITETSYIAHPKETMKVLEAMKELGVSLWLDDFGSGHSSLTHLQHFPLDGIKVPGSFMKEVPRDRRSTAITRSMIELAHAIGLEVIAEGVEHQAQLDFLRELECEAIQGFLFSRPMTLEAFQQLLDRAA
jgi:EAL domain-containing protein (putative c-di-GMP-specific phosphodiesterase class I)